MTLALTASLAGATLSPFQTSFTAGGIVGETARRWRSSVSLTIGVAALVVAWAVPTSAQILYGSLTGIVKDATGGRLPGATVTVVNKDNNLTREATADADGVYNIINLQPGRYDMRISLSGFREASRTSVPITIGEISRIDVALEIG